MTASSGSTCDANNSTSQDLIRASHASLGHFTRIVVGTGGLTCPCTIMATPEAQDAAAKQRIIKHMNADHHDSVRYFVHCVPPTRIMLADDTTRSVVMSKPTPRKALGKATPPR